MSVATASVDRTGGEAAHNTPVRVVLFLAAFFLFWVTVSPFHDLADPSRLSTLDSSNLSKQLAISATAIVLLAFAGMNGWRKLVTLASPSAVLAIIALALSAVLSLDPVVSLKRFVLALLMIVIASVTLILPPSRRWFADMLALAAVTVLVTCYVGLLTVPHLAIHHVEELIEIEHAGLWRGLFAHKNEAGAAMALLVMIGIFVARARSMLLGIAIAALAVLFLLRTGAKTATGLLPVALLASLFVVRTRHWVRAAAIIGVILLFNLIAVGSAFFSPIRWLVEQVMSDPTFTSRDDVWRFAIANIIERPLVGHGFQAFWDSVKSSGDSIETWAARVGHAHNSYVDVAVMSGLPALLLVANWLLVQPLTDLRDAGESSNDPVLTLLFVQVWIFGLLHACLENSFFIADSPLWFMFLIGVFGLRMQATRRLVA